jgi:hypothetical protein
MTGPLDKLRNALGAEYDKGVGVTRYRMDDIFTEFEQAHPGLVDRTAICNCCGVAHDPFTQWMDDTLNRFAFCAECADRTMTTDPCPKCGAKP